MDIETFIRSHRVARLATITPDGRPHIVPVVYAYDGARVFIALDEKPKRVAPAQLQRARNIAANPNVALLIDDYDEDWARLAWVRLDGVAEVLASGKEQAQALRLLREKYAQHQPMQLEERPLIQMTIKLRTHWEAS
jgi:PPOX class probable F420-dependent enzyme